MQRSHRSGHEIDALVVCAARGWFVGVDLRQSPVVASTAPRCSALVVTALVGYGFTTHVRELQELLWQALRDGDGAVLGPPPELVRIARPRPDAPEPTPALASLTRAVVLGVLERCAGVKEVAWRELGLRNRYQLNRVLKKLGIE